MGEVKGAVCWRTTGVKGRLFAGRGKGGCLLEDDRQGWER